MRMKEPRQDSAEAQVEIVAFHRGERQSARVLSRRCERRAAARVAGWLLGGASAALGVFVVLARAMGFVFYAPVFLATWVGATAFVALLVVRQVRRRVNRYRIGASVEADAFASQDLELVRPAGDSVGARAGFELALAPGMRGFLQEGGARTPIEGLVRPRAVHHVPLGPGVHARVELDSTTFVVQLRAAVASAGAARVAPAEAELQVGSRQVVAAELGRHLGLCARCLVGACIVSTLFAIEAPPALGDADLKSSIPAHLTPYQIELKLREQAQIQASTLHACFAPMPLFCQRAGYVGVGLRLGADGAVKSSWVARTTYNEECPVTACMEQVIAGWFFEPIRHPMTLVIPVQVFRTKKPLPESAHAGLLD